MTMATLLRYSKYEEIHGNTTGARYPRSGGFRKRIQRAGAIDMFLGTMALNIKQIKK